jgi:hypothetical protein
MIDKIVTDLKKQIPRGIKKEQKEELASAEKVLAWLQSGKDVRNGMDEWNLKDVDFLNERQLLSAKPVVYLVNLSPEDYARKKNKWLAKIAAWVDAHGGGKIIPFSAALEAQLVDMPDDERAAYVTANAGSESALPKIIKTGFAAIQLIYFFTAGEDEVKCWTLRRGMKAPQAAGTIHTDFEKGFICAEVMAFEELREAGSESAVKAKGRYRQEGKGYLMVDGDVVLFKFGSCLRCGYRGPSARADASALFITLLQDVSTPHPLAPRTCPAAAQRAMRARADACAAMQALEKGQRSRGRGCSAAQQQRAWRARGAAAWRRIARAIDSPVLNHTRFAASLRVRIRR